MAIFIDILLASVFVLCIIRHARLGLACSVLSAIRLVGSLLAASLIYYPVARLLHAIGVAEAVSGTVAFIAVFIASMIFSKLLIRVISNIKIPIVTRVDKFLGFLLGIVLGFVFTSLISTVIYTLLDLFSALSDSSNINAYNDSYLFEFIYELKIFEFIRNLF